MTQLIATSRDTAPPTPVVTNHLKQLARLLARQAAREAFARSDVAQTCNEDSDDHGEALN